MARSMRSLSLLGRCGYPTQLYGAWPDRCLSSRGIDIRNLPMLVPPTRLNETAHVVEAELIARAKKISDKVEAGTIEESTES